MPLPAIDTLCRALDPAPLNLRVRLPGGAEISAIADQLPPSLFSLAQQLLGQASSALAPLSPIFTIVEAVVAVQKCLTAVVDALGPPPDPGKLLECLPELAKKIEEIIALLPPTSVLALLVDVLDAIIATLHGTILELQAVQRLLNSIAAARNLSTTVEGLAAVVLCGEQSADIAMDNIRGAFGSLNSLIEALNGFAAMAGIDGAIPTLDNIPDDPTQAIAFLQSGLDLLVTFRDSIPVG